MSVQSARAGIFLSVFGEEQAHMYGVLHALASYAQGQTYSFMDLEEFNDLIREEPKLGQEVYWRELVGRAHFAATSSAVRHLRWLDVTLDSITASNYLGFSAGFRSLLESVADSMEALYYMPGLLAANGSMISRILHGEDLGKEMHVSAKAEEILIHFTHGRKSQLSPISPASHHAKTNRDYLKALERAKLSQVHECYSELCDVCHPATFSVLSYVKGVREDKHVLWHIDVDSDAQLIEEFLTKYDTLRSDLVPLATNPILLTLYVIDKLPMRDWRCSMISEFDLSGIHGFQEIKSLIDTWA